jgi:hypothetical protein
MSDDISVKVSFVPDTKQLQKEIEKVKKSLSTFDNDITLKIGLETDVKSEIKKIQKELKAVSGGVTIDVNADTKGALNDIKKLQKEADKLDDEFTDISIDLSDSDTKKFKAEIDDLVADSNDSLGGIGLGVGIGVGLAGLTAGLIGVVNAGAETEKTMAKVQAQTGKTDAEMLKLKESSKDIFKAGVGENLDEVVNAMGFAEQQFKSFKTTLEDGTEVDFDTETFVKGAGAISQVFDKDINEVIEKSRTSIKAFGLDGEQAVGFISSVLKDAPFDDTLDIISEYAPLMKQAGLGAEEFGVLIKRSAEEGIFDLDKMGDSIKEADIRIKAGDFETAFEGLSEGATDAEQSVIDMVNGIAQKAQAGDISVIEAMGLTATAVQDGIDTGAISQSMAQALQVAIAGTPAEDLGVEAFNNIFSAPIPTGLLEQKGKEASESLAKGLEFQGLINRITSLFTGLSDFIFTALKPVFNVMATELIPIIEETFVALQPLIGAIINGLKVAFEILLPPLKILLQGFGLFLDIASVVANKTIEIVSSFLKWATSFDFVQSAIKSTVSFLSQLVDGVTGAVDTLKSFFGLSDDSTEKNLKKTSEATKELTKEQKEANKEKQRAEAIEKAELKRQDDLLKVKNSHVTTSKSLTKTKAKESEATKALAKAEADRLKNLETSKGTLKELLKTTDRSVESLSELEQAYIKLAIAENKQSEIDKAYIKSLDDIVNAEKIASEQKIADAKLQAELSEQLRKEDLEQVKANQDAKDELKQQELDKAQERADEMLRIQESLALNVGAMIGETTAQMLNGQKEWGEGMKMLLFDVLSSSIQAYAGAVIAREIATKGPIGIATGAALSAVILGLLGGLRASLFSGAEDGVVGIDNNYNGKIGKTDVIPTMLAHGETVTSKKMTDKHRDLLEAVHSDNVDGWLDSLSGFGVSRAIETPRATFISNAPNHTNMNEGAVVSELRSLRMQTNHQTQVIAHQTKQIEVLQGQKLQTTKVYLDVNDKSTNGTKLSTRLRR